MQILAKEEERSMSRKRRPREEHLKMTNYPCPIEPHDLSLIAEKPIVHTKIILVYKILGSISLLRSNWSTQERPDARLWVKITVNGDKHLSVMRMCQARGSLKFKDR